MLVTMNTQDILKHAKVVAEEQAKKVAARKVNPNSTTAK